MTELIDFTTIPAHLVDRQPLPRLSLDHLDMEAVGEHVREAQQRNRFKGPSDPLEYLQSRVCVVSVEGQLRPTVAGVLCFGHNPQAILPQAVIDVGRFRGFTPISAEVVDLQKHIGGTVIEQINRIETYLWEQSTHGMTIGASSRRIELHEYPRVVIRELLANMVAHRDYRITTSVARVEKLRDRIQWISPGGLPEGVTIANLLNAQQSRNPTIVQVLVDTGMVEAFGMGLDTVVKTLERERMRAPKFEDFNAFFMVTVYGHAQEEFTSTDIAQRLSDRQLHILNYIRTEKEVKSQNISVLFKERYTQRSIQRDLREMVEAGLIMPEGKGRATVYRVNDQESSSE